MILTFDQLKEKYKDYSNIKTKISREVEKGNLFRIKKGLFETNNSVLDYCLSQVIYGPSYISFRYALAYHQMIPERVYEVTSASYNKNKIKYFECNFGRYSYSPIPNKVYNLGIDYLQIDGYPVFMAEKEKALSDSAYKHPIFKNLKDVEYYLFEQLRIEEEELENLDFKLLKEISGAYHSKNVTLLYKFLYKKYNLKR